MVRQAVELASERLPGGTDSARLICLAHAPVVRITWRFDAAGSVPCGNDTAAWLIN